MASIIYYKKFLVTVFSCYKRCHLEIDLLLGRHCAVVGQANFVDIVIESVCEYSSEVINLRQISQV